VILSHQNTRTASEALRRDGLACPVSGERHVALKGTVSTYAEFWCASSSLVTAAGSALPSLTSSSFGFAGRPSSIFGGLSGLKQAGSRMPTAPLTLDPSANQEEGGP
jgi:hypothetical protein